MVVTSEAVGGRQTGLAAYRPKCLINQTGNTPFSQNAVAARSSAAETTAACRKCPCWQRRASCWHRSDPQTTAERFKKIKHV